MTLSTAWRFLCGVDGCMVFRLKHCRRFIRPFPRFPGNCFCHSHNQASILATFIVHLSSSDRSTSLAFMVLFLFSGALPTSLCNISCVEIISLRRKATQKIAVLNFHAAPHFQDGPRGQPTHTLPNGLMQKLTGYRDPPLVPNRSANSKTTMNKSYKN